MEIRITVQELSDKGVWEQSCDYTGFSVYALNEGLPYDFIVTLNPEQAISLGLIAEAT